MSAVPAGHSARRGSRWPLVLGVVIIVLLAGMALIAPSVVLHGWLVAFASTGGVALGCAGWLAIHALTGGRWGETGRAALLAGGSALPILLILVLPLIFADRWLYRWAADSSATASDVAHLYLNTWGLALRSLVLLGGLSLAALQARKGALAPLVAGLALLLYGGLMNLSAFDWLLSLDPRYTSSAIGMQVIAAQLLSALCFVVLATDAPENDPVWGDYGGLMLACLLGEAYLVFMTFIIHWYGNLPDQAAWYLARSRGAWGWLAMLGTVFGAIGPGLALLFGRIRQLRRRLRIVARVILVGLVVENIWLVAPSAGPQGGWVILAGVAALVACISLTLGVAGRPLSTLARKDSTGMGHV